MITTLTALLWLLPCAWQDWHSRRVSNGLTLSGLALAGLYRGVSLADPLGWLGLALVPLFLAGYGLGWFGGADLKALLALSLLDVRLVAWALAGACLWYGLEGLIHRTRPAQIPGLAGYALGLALLFSQEVTLLILT